jgi:rSAM/selenodomain-associated transferase 1
MRNGLIIFVRNPELGKVKTRLAIETGDAKALQVYTELLQHTHDNTSELSCDKFVYYADYINENDLWENGVFQKRLQEGALLGDRMMLAFFDLFQQGYSKLVIIGSDCPELSVSVINQAFEKLDQSEVVVGPSSDGGYYLLGLTYLIPELFKNKSWSTESVFKDTIKDTILLKKQCSFLPEFSDIDTADDLQRYYQLLKS